jgi:hypothetical protein
MPDLKESGHDETPEVNGTERRESERRFHVRYPFIASVEAIEPQSHATLKGRISDLGFGGCYVDTMNPFAVGTIIKIRLTKDEAAFEADAKVMFSHAGMGMGVAFVSTVPQQLQILHDWLAELAEKTFPEQEPPTTTEPDAAAANSVKNQDVVLRELVEALIRKGVLSELEGKTMLHRLHD